MEREKKRVANPRPRPNLANLKPIKPGEVRNPRGYSQKRRVMDAMVRFMDRLEGSDEDLARTLYAMATGRRDLLKIRDPETGKVEYRRPEFAWFALLLERLEGKVPSPAPDTTDNPDPGGIAAATLHALEEANRPDADPGPAAPPPKRRRAGKAKGGARKPRPGVGRPGND
jgi:hypothetical protein